MAKLSVQITLACEVEVTWTQWVCVCVGGGVSKEWHVHYVAGHNVSSTRDHC